MKLTVLGGIGAYPTVAQGCSGYLVEHDGFRLLLDPGYATLPGLLALTPAAGVDAVLVTHGHPDHCADLHPLLRARALARVQTTALPLYALPGALTAVLGLDEPGLIDSSYSLESISLESISRRFTVGPFTVEARELPHFVPNVGFRIEAGGRALAYTGDTGPDPAVVALARDADLLLAEATYAGIVPERHLGNLTSAREAGTQARDAGAGRLVLTHLWPGSDPAAFLDAAQDFTGPIDIATPGLVWS
jgi:ribonuclease BN (tRNA processing enzyme)